MAGYRGEGYGIHGDHGDDDYYDDIRGEREGRNRDEERPMFGGYEEDSFGRKQFSPRHEGDRGFFDRARDEARSWVSDRDQDRRAGSDRIAADYRRRFGMQGHEGQYGDRSTGGFSSQDDHYRSWRNRQMQELDRDYREYCREREQQFHEDFGNWRSNRSRSAQPPQEVAEHGSNASSEGAVTSTLTLDTPAGGGGQAGPSESSQHDSLGTSESAGSGRRTSRTSS